MQVLLVTDDLPQQEAIMIPFIKAGVLVTATSSLKVAEAFISTNVVDLLVASERVRGRLSHSTILMAEHQHAHLSTILLTDRTDRDAEEVFELIPSVHALIGTGVPGEVVLQFGRASVVSKSKPAPLTFSSRFGRVVEEDASRRIAA
ncbi:hypothetical protein AIOL_003057 [Candidatus Rhodobacter oscarellae]|uniref:Uncharacterized protein n=1 Tax=Candidatus Rhodobacter oscarellae TaxID=1675527 RepID=A0A0J9E5S3_9RHOB|nr:hypothetical protein [Candidatus Rhodobacter lobularis]KMW58087.1 hypothetical protein AIOL_003057 [Candidatus Rhodobacter lobularis]